MSQITYRVSRIRSLQYRLHLVGFLLSGHLMEDPQSLEASTFIKLGRAVPEPLLCGIKVQQLLHPVGVLATLVHP